MSGVAYDIAEHVHRYSTWTAARAVSRNFTNTARVRSAIEASDLPETVAGDPSKWPSTSVEADIAQRRWAGQVLTALLDAGISTATFGRASKIVAIYLKTVVIMRMPEHPFAKVAHPPIDAILLAAIARDVRIPGGLRSLCRATRWTQLDEASYCRLVAGFRDVGLDQPAFWSIERYWNPERE